MFNPDIPDQCPPSDAEPANTTIYRQVSKLPICGEQFLSHAELKKGSYDLNNCNHWGCSVWIDKEAVSHARSIIPFFKKTYIIGGNVDRSDGVIKHTPSGNQDQHYTFWKFFRKDISGKFQIVLKPNEEFS